jgi:hypothetical protein
MADQVIQSGKGQKKAATRSTNFKYYIHDRVDSLRLQMFGVLTEIEVTELSGCWQTAKTMLGKRPVVLDLRQLQSTDEAGRQWIAAMVSDGAVCEPEGFLRGTIAAPAAAQSEPIKRSFWARLANLLKAGAQSTT